MLIQTQSTKVKCDGGKGSLGHPLVFLNIDDQVGTVECPYCSTMFQLSYPEKQEASKNNGIS
jgi:uncharacterized Zn-finger protein